MLYTCVAKLSTKELVAPHTYLFIFTLQEPTTLPFAAGQYVLLNLQPEGFRQYSIASAPPQTAEIETVVDTIPMGPGSQYLLSLSVGDTVHFRAPMGVFILKKTPLPKIFLATGTGITPLHSMLLGLTANNPAPPCYLFWGLRYREDVYYLNTWQSLAQANHNFFYHICLSREQVLEELAEHEKHFLYGRIPQYLEAMIRPEHAQDAEWYLCGRPAIVEELMKFIQQTFHTPKERLFHEKYT